MFLFIFEILFLILIFIAPFIFFSFLGGLLFWFIVSLII